MGSKTKNSGKQAEIEARRLRIATLYHQGAHRQIEIVGRLAAEGINVDRATVSRDLAALRAEWRTRAAVEIEASKSETLEEIESLKREYWNAWELSKQPKQKTATAKGDRGSTARVEKEERTPDPRYLQGVQWCIEQRCKIIGLNAPEKHKELTWEDDLADLVKSGKATLEDVESEFGKEIAARIAARVGMVRRQDGAAEGEGAAAEPSGAGADSEVPLSQ